MLLWWVGFSSTAITPPPPGPDVTVIPEHRVGNRSHTYYCPVCRQGYVLDAHAPHHPHSCVTKHGTRYRYYG